MFCRETLKIVMLYSDHFFSLNLGNFGQNGYSKSNGMMRTRGEHDSLAVKL